MAAKSNRKKPLKTFNKLMLVFVISFSFVLLLSLFFSKKSEDYKIVSASLEIQAPFSRSYISIQQNGRVAYEAIDRSGKHRNIQKSKTVAEMEFKKLEKLIIEKELIYKNAEVTQPGPEVIDGLVYTISVSTLPAKRSQQILADIAVHEISCYQLKCNQDLLEVKDEIIEIWGEEVLEVGI